LLRHARAAVDAAAAQAQNLGKLFALAKDLKRQLACRRHDESDGSIQVAQRGLVEHVAKHGEQKRESLARTGLGHANHVAPAHYRGNGLLLNSKGRH
jgi:hypothetical protein